MIHDPEQPAGETPSGPLAAELGADPGWADLMRRVFALDVVAFPRCLPR